MPFGSFFIFGGETMSRDMTQGSLAGILVRFSIPLVLSGLLQQLYAWADAFIVGNVEGERALAAIGATTALSNLFVMVITGITLGPALLSARLWGQGRRGELSPVLSSFAVVLGGAFLVIGLGGSAAVRPVLAAIHTPELDQACRYLGIVLLGLPFVAVYNVYAAVLRGMGDSRVPLLAVLVASVVNVGLDLVLVAGLEMGVAGAAAATVAAQGMMMVFILLYTVGRCPELRFRPGPGCLSGAVLRQGMALGVPSAIQSSVNSLGSVALQNFMNGFGTQTVAAITTAYRVDTVLLLPIINLSSGISTVAAQNMGAGRPRRAREILRVGSTMMAAVSLALTGLVLAVGEPVIALFGVTEQAAAQGGEFFANIAGFYLVYGLSMALRGYLEGLGDVLYSSLTGIACLGLRIGLSYALADWAGWRIIAWAEAVSWCVMLLLYLGRGLTRGRRLTGEGAA